jgi:SAM-dependent methyltransferase
VPVLINEEKSLFSIESFVKEESSTFFPESPTFRRFVYSLLPSMSFNPVGKRNYRKLASLLLAQNTRPTVLILGGSVLGAGMEEFRANPAIEFVDSDISFGPLTKMICDGHDLPCPDAAFDCIVAQAVLEHVADPYRCVDEMHRVLKPEGLVYTEIPFMQPAHDTPFDFQRFTFTGYRRLFRRFEQIEFGPVGGPAEAFGRLYEGMLLCLGSSRALRACLLVFARWTGFWWKYLDYLFNRTPYAIHCASGQFFLGRKSLHTLTDREVIEQVRHM